MVEEVNSDVTAADDNEQIQIRKGKLQELRQQGNAYPNDFRKEYCSTEILSRYENKSAEELQAVTQQFSLAGRIMTRRIMGKASFIHVQDMRGQLQVYVQRDALADGVYQSFKRWDLGDIVGLRGQLFKTKTGELTIKASEIRLLTKALRPLPEKYHGLTNVEQRYRQRYLDLIVNKESRQVFMQRNRCINAVRNFLTERDFLEVETPMMQVIPGGATARPFVTHHNSLNIDMYMRVSPELYLKRLVVGGFERVFEINRNFRNEGLSTRHNPEFTMIEYYHAYIDYHEAMDFLEEMLRQVTQCVVGKLQFTYQQQQYDLQQPFQRLTVFDSILKYNPEVSAAEISSLEQAVVVARRLGIEPKSNWGLGKVQIEIFEKTVEPRLLEPTFITAYPAEVSPLARRNEADPFLCDRFELMIAGRELANGFSELNDPEDQAARFKQQVAEKEAGDEEAMFYDEDYIVALEHGLPPTAGVGIGIDRLVMFLSDSPSIRDVILFPHMRQQTE